MQKGQKLIFTSNYWFIMCTGKTFGYRSFLRPLKAQFLHHSQTSKQTQLMQVISKRTLPLTFSLLILCCQLLATPPYGPTTCDLPAPQGLHLVYVSSNSAHAAWNNVSAAAAYEAFLQDETDGDTFTNITPNSNISYAAPIIEAGHKYTLKITPICSNGIKSNNSSSLKFTASILIVIDIVERDCNPTKKDLALPGTYCFDLNNIAPKEFDLEYDFGNGNYAYYRFTAIPQNGSGAVMQIKRYQQIGAYSECLENTGSAVAGCGLIGIKITGNSASNSGLPIATLRTFCNNSMARQGLVIEITDPNTRLYSCSSPSDCGEAPSLKQSSGNNNPEHSIFSEIATELESAETATAQALHYSPNPVNNVLNISFIPRAANTLITVQNTNGTVLHTQTIEAAETPYQETNFQINTSNWPPGLYIISMNNGHDYMTGKILKR